MLEAVKQFFKQELICISPEGEVKSKRPHGKYEEVVSTFPYVDRQEGEKKIRKRKFKN